MWIILNIYLRNVCSRLSGIDASEENNTPISEDIIIADNDVSTSVLKNGNSQVSPSNYLRIFGMNLWFLNFFFS